MGLLELFIIAFGLSMDAFAVAVCTGLSMRRVTFKKALTVGLYFGVFQAGMPLAGYLLGVRFADKIEAIDHWVAFALLGFIGAKMFIDGFKEARSGADEAQCTTADEPSLSPATMLPLAVATSIDALAAGVSFAFLHVQIVPAVAFIGIITLALSMAGVKIGNVFGAKFQSRAEMTGGVILVLMGIKILLEHTGVISW